MTPEEALQLILAKTQSEPFSKLTYVGKNFTLQDLRDIAQQALSEEPQEKAHG